MLDLLARLDPPEKNFELELTLVDTLFFLSTLWYSFALGISCGRRTFLAARLFGLLLKLCEPSSLEKHSLRS
jgi:hypothetical protein